MNIKPISANKWFLDVRLHRAGHRVKRKVKTFTGGKLAAEKLWHEMYAELKCSPSGDRSLKTLSFKHIIDYYLERNNIDKDSLYYFKKLKFDLGNIYLQDLQSRFDSYLQLLKKAKVKNTGKAYSNQTINHYLKWSKVAINFCIMHGLIKDSPLKCFKPLTTTPRSRILTENEKKTLLEVVREESPHIYPIVLYSMMVPSRRGELVALKRAAYNRFNNTITVPGDITKNKRPCIKPVPVCMREYFQNVPVESEYLFYRQDWKGEYHSLGNFRKSFKRCLKIACIEDYRFHDSRRCAYTELLLKNNNPFSVMQISGHKTDMSKVYFGRNELLAAQSINFGKSVYLYSKKEVAVGEST